VNKSSINAPTSFGWHHTNGVGGSEKTLVEEDKAPVSEVQQKNKALMRRFLEAQEKGDLDAVKEMMAPDFVDHSALPGQAPNREDYIRDLTEDQAAFSNFRYIIEDQAAEADKVISRCTISAIHDRGEVLGFTPTGRKIETTYISIHRIEGGKIAEEWSEGGGLLELTQQRLEQEIRERERIEQDLRVARHIQQASLPKEVPTLEGWQITPYYQSAREVGGDFYDFHLLPEGRLGLVVGDATGKGVPAALVMSTTCGMLQLAARALDSSSPGKVLEQVNETLVARIPSNMFVTCFYAILEPKSGRLLYANAGHDLPYLHHSGECEELRARGMPLGLMPGMSYEEKEIELDVGEGVFFYSDGLVEAHDPKGEMFGFPRLRALVAQHAEERSLGNLLLEELYSFVGEGWEQEDDITLLTLQRRAPRR
jgi:serine phosphatase RsbU (regulator of sigma subunit)/predicted ester cyclase